VPKKPTDKAPLTPAEPTFDPRDLHIRDDILVDDAGREILQPPAPQI
jgi:hypothetical protein